MQFLSDIASVIYLYTGIDGGVIEYLGEITYVSMRINFNIIADYDSGADVGKGTNINILSDFGRRINKTGLFNTLFLQGSFWYKVQAAK